MALAKTLRSRESVTSLAIHCSPGRVARPAGDGRWNITRDSVVVDWCDKKDDAVTMAVTRCHVSQTAGVNCQLLIKGKDGRIQDERTYGDDPPEIKG